MRLIDIGANLTHESFRHDLDEVLAHARDAGIVHLVVTGASRQGSIDARALAAAHPSLLSATAGLHPHHAAEYDADTEEVFAELLADPLVRAVGETGLDYYRDLAPRAAQQFAFERQLGLGLATGKPLFLHQRDAHADFLAILKPLRDRLGPACVHCFTGVREELIDYLDLDCHIGITGWICDERRGTHLKELVRLVPADRLLVETDAPYLMPRDLHPKPSHRRNEPKFLPHIVRAIAAARGEDPAALAEVTTRNAIRFFGLEGAVGEA
jgi:TatD DNase family protein